MAEMVDFFTGGSMTEEQLQAEVTTTFERAVKYLTIDPSSQTSKERTLKVRFVANGFQTGKENATIINRQHYSAEIDGDTLYLALPPKGHVQSEEYKQKFSKLSKLTRGLAKEAEKGNQAAIALKGKKSDAGNVKGHIKWSSADNVIVQVIEDSQVPENVGKYFIMQLNDEIMQKINTMLRPTPTEIADGAKVTNIWFFFNAPVFRIIAGIGTKEYANAKGEIVKARTFAKSKFLPEYSSVLLKGKPVSFTQEQLDAARGIGGKKPVYTKEMIEILNEYTEQVKPQVEELMFSEEKTDWARVDKFVEFIHKAMGGELPLANLGVSYDYANAYSSKSNKTNKPTKTDKPQTQQQEHEHDTEFESDFDNMDQEFEG